MSESRPSHFPPGTPVGEHYTVEGLVRLAEGRMFYLVTDARPDKPQRKCWECGEIGTPRTEKACRSCGAAFKDRRFLMSARWESALFDAYEKFFAKGLAHPGLASPLDVFRQAEQLLSVVSYNGEGLMIDEASPLPNQRILDVAQRVAGTLAFLHVNGVRLRGLTRANLLISPDNTIRLFDVDVVDAGDLPVTNGLRGAEMASIGEMLRRYCDVDSDVLAEFMESVEVGSFDAPSKFGRATEQRYDAVAAVNYKPLRGAMSDVGLTRQLNEDNWGWKKLSERSQLFVIADGMGGHDSGEVASMLAVQTICKVARETEKNAAGVDQIEAMLDHAFQTANNTIKENAEEKGTDMGTTLVCCLLFEGKTAFVGNVGDSRCYMVRDNKLHQVSKDHSLVAKMVEKGRITAEEARNHPHSNILLRTVGTERDVDIDIFRVDALTGDRFIMCTDGLWGEVEDRDIEAIMVQYPDPRIAARELVRAAHHGGGKDNVSLIIMTVP
jgi:PPM family protein phosphatase